jgi:toxin ParE1/3/4
LAAGLTLDWTPIAAMHLRAVYQYVARENTGAAEALIERIFSAVEMLERYPHMGRGGRVEGTRELVVAGTRFVVVYRPRRNRIEVLAVLHAARKWPEEF